MHGHIDASTDFMPFLYILVIISSDKDDLFMGFIANMRLARDPSVIVGTVIEPQDNNTLIKTMTCNGANVSYYKCYYCGTHVWM